jgi:hypothetical protein
MANAAAVIWGGIRHPARTVLKRWSGELPSQSVNGSNPRATDRSENIVRSTQHARYPAHQSPERLERIALYARSGYFHMDYTAAMFVVPFDIPPE